jgi:hypothetical protein
MKTIAFAVIAIALAAPAVAGSNAKQANAAPKKPHLICKRDTATGSHMTPVVCKTADQWEAANMGSAQLNAMNHGATGGSGQSTLPSQ